MSDDIIKRLRCVKHTADWQACDEAADLIKRMAQRVPVDLHPRTADLVDRFALALKQKLAAAEKKYGYSDGWADDDWMDECRGQLLSHVEKGDPRDVAAYCAFLWHHGESTAPPARDRQRVPLTVDRIEELANQHNANLWRYHAYEQDAIIRLIRAVECEHGIVDRQEDAA